MRRRLWAVVLACVAATSRTQMPSNGCRCPPANIILPDGQKGVVESQRAHCRVPCLTTIIAENPSEVVVFTFSHIPPDFGVEVYDGPEVSSSRSMEPRCPVQPGRQCASTRNEVTFVFVPRWTQESTSLGAVELFLLATSPEHAEELVQHNNPPAGLAPWKVWVICVASVLVLIVFLVALLLCVRWCLVRRRAKEQIKTMQSCMIFAASHKHRRIDAF